MVWGAVLAAGGAVQRVKLVSSLTAEVKTVEMASILPRLALTATA